MPKLSQIVGGSIVTLFVMQCSVLQWNVWYEENIENVLSFLEAQKADIVCLQELTKGYVRQMQENTWEYLAEMLGYEVYAWEVPIITTTGQWTQANAIFSSFPIVDRSGVWLHEPAVVDGYDDQYRSYIEVTVDIKGEKFEVGTTHMSHLHQFPVTPQKRQEVKRLTDILDTKKQQYILTGDFNALPESYTISEISKRLKHAGPDFDQHTWTTKPHAFPGKVISRLAWRYDYVFATNDMHVSSAKILATDISDHLPIWATFELG